MLAAITLALVAAIRFVPFQTPYPLLPLESLAFWALAPAYVLAPLCAWRGERRLAAAFAMIALAQLAWTFEWIPRAQASAPSRPLAHVVDANLLAPRPSRALARELIDSGADVLLVQELSDAWLALLDEEVIEARFPYRVVEPHPTSEDYFGIGIFSAHPITRSGIERLGAEFIPMAWADLEIGGRAFRVYSIHTAPPGSAEWAEIWEPQMRALEARARADLSETDRVLIMAGDFNASPFSFAHRRLLSTGLTEAHEQAFRGWATTWPNGLFSVPPMRLDHVYVHGAGVREVRELPAISSDHSPVSVWLGE